MNRVRRMVHRPSSRRRILKVFLNLVPFTVNVTWVTVNNTDHTVNTIEI